MSELGPHVLTAPAKLNLCLYLGGTRDDGLHELCSCSPRSRSPTGS